MPWLTWITLLAAIIFLASLAAVAIVQAWAKFVARRPEEAFAVGAVGVVAAGVIGAVLEAVRL